MLAESFVSAIEKDFDVSSYGWIGFSILSDTLPTTLGVIELVRKKYPKARLLGGNHESTVNIQDCVGKSQLDGVILADAEEPMHALLSGVEPSKIPGVLWRTFNPQPRREQFEEWNRAIKWSEIPYRQYWNRTKSLYHLDSMSDEDRLTKLYEIHTVRIHTIVACQLSCTYCFSSGYVQTERGFKDISEIVKENEPVRVVQHDGTIGNAVRFSARWYRGPLIRVTPRYLNALKATPGHVLHVKTAVGDITQKKIEDITLGDRLRVPFPKTANHVSELNLSELVIQGGQTPLVANGRVRVKMAKRNLPATITWTPKFARFLGLYAAEGGVSIFANRPNSANVVLTFSEEETDYIQFSQEVFQELGLSPHLSHTPPTCQVVAGSSVLGLVLTVLLGNGATDKLLHPIILGLPRDLFFAFVAGWLQGDGNRGSIETGTKLRGSTTSPSLAYGLWLGLIKHGVDAALQYNKKPRAGIIEGRAVAQSDSYEVHLLSGAGAEEIARLAFGTDYQIRSRMNWTIERDEDAAYLPIASMDTQEGFAGTVYNMEVEPAHTYTVNGVAVNNCSVANTRRIAAGSMKSTITNLSMNALAENLLRIKREVPDVMTIYDSSDEAWLGKGRAEEYLAAVESVKEELDRGLPRGIRLLVQCRVQDLDEEIIIRAAKAGVRHLTVGVESPIERVRKDIKKPQKEELVRNVAKWCTANGINPYMLFIMFLPTITLEELHQAVENWRIYMALGATISVEPMCMLYLGTTMYDDPELLTEYAGYEIPFSGPPNKRLKWATLIWPKDRRVCAVLQWFRANIDDFIVEAKKKMGHAHTFKGETGKITVDCLEVALKLYDEGKIPPWNPDGQGHRSMVYQDYGDQMSGSEIAAAASTMLRANKTTTRFNSTHATLDDPNAGIKGRIKDPALPHEMLPLPDKNNDNK